MQYKNDAIQSFNNFILFSSVIVFFIIAHRGVEETVAASLDAPRLKSRPGDGDVHPTEIVTAHANYNPSLLFYTTAKTSKLIEFSLSFFPYGKRTCSENLKILETFDDVLFWKKILFVFRGRGLRGTAKTVFSHFEGQN